MSSAHGSQKCTSAYMLFSIAYRGYIERKSPGANSIERAKILAQRWKDLPNNKKIYWKCIALMNLKENSTYQGQLESSPNSLFDEISALAKVSCPLAPPKLLPISHGVIIAVEGLNCAVIQNTMHYVFSGLNSPYWAKIFQTPDLPVYKDLQDADQQKAYHDAIKMWQGVSDDMINHINFGTFKSIPDSLYHIPHVPVAIVGQYQLTTTKAIFGSGPSQNIHQNALPDSWNTCVGPDIIIFIDENARGPVEAYIHGPQMIIICPTKPGKQCLNQAKLQHLLLQLRLKLAERFEKEDGIKRLYKVRDGKLESGVQDAGVYTGVGPGERPLGDFWMRGDGAEQAQ